MPRKKDKPDDSGLTFNEGLHEYRYNNIVVPSVTQIISTYMGMDMSHIPERYRDRGVAVHKAIELLVKDELDDSTVMSELMPYVNAYKLFQEDYGWEVGASEDKRYHSEMEYAGTIDQLGRFKDDKKETVLEIKTGQKAKYHQLQTAGYAMLYDPKRPTPRFTLYVDAEGDYELIPHDNNEDYKAFASLLDARAVNFNYGGRLR